ncbi:MAG: EamA family transporter, partial [Prevotella sp.]|nr:EamA family transporter [Prevotella sp.]
VIAWYNIYQFLWMCILVALMTRKRKGIQTRFEWRWSIVLISVFLVASDFTYFSSLACDGAMVSVLSMVRRSNVVVSFVFGVLLLGEKNWRGKAFDLLLVIIGMVFVWLGTR